MFGGHDASLGRRGSIRRVLVRNCIFTGWQKRRWPGCHDYGAMINTTQHVLEKCPRWKLQRRSLAASMRVGINSLPSEIRSIHKYVIKWKLWSYPRTLNTTKVMFIISICVQVIMERPRALRAASIMPEHLRHCLGIHALDALCSSIRSYTF